MKGSTVNYLTAVNLFEIGHRTIGNYPGKKTNPNNQPVKMTICNFFFLVLIEFIYIFDDIVPYAISLNYEKAYICIQDTHRKK